MSVRQVIQALPPNKAVKVRISFRRGRRASVTPQIIDVTTPNTFDAYTAGVADSITGQGALATLSAVGSAQITDGSVGSAEIAAAAVLQSKLAGGDSANLIPDVHFADTAVWTLTGSATISTASDITTGLAAVRGIASASGNGTTSQTTSTAHSALYRSSVRPGRPYIFSVETRRTTGFTGIMQLFVAWLKQDGTLSSTAFVNGTDYRTVAAGSAGNQTLVLRTVAPADAVYFYIAFNFVWSTTLSNAGQGFAAMPRAHQLSQLNQNVVREDGTTIITDASAITSLGTAAAITSQGALATMSLVTAAVLAAGVGQNAIVDSGFRLPATYWTESYTSAGTWTRAQATQGGQRIYTVTATGTPGNATQVNVGLGNVAAALLPVAPGDRVEASAYVAGVNLSAARVYLQWFDEAGASVTFSQVASILSSIPTGTGALSTFTRIGGIATAPAGAYRCQCLIVFTTDASATPACKVTRPYLGRANAGQTELTPWAPGVEGELGADVTLTHTAASVTGQGALATLSSVAAAQIGANAVTASKVAVSDSTNMLLGVDFADASYWVFGGTGVGFDTSSDVTTTLGAARGVKFTASGANPQSDAACATVSRHLVEPGKTYRVYSKVLHKSGFRGRINLYLNWYDQGGGFLSTGQIQATDYRTTPAGSDLQETLDGILVAPAGAYSAEFRYLCDWPNAAASAGAVYGAFPRWHRATQLNSNIVREDGTTPLTDNAAVTSLGTASAIAGQGSLATANTVDTSDIDANAVSEILYAESSSVGNTTNGYFDILTKSVTVATGEVVLIHAFAKMLMQLTRGSGTPVGNGQYRLTRDGSVIKGPYTMTGPQGQIGTMGMMNDVIAILDVDDPGAGTYTYAFQAQNLSSGGGGSANYQATATAPTLVCDLRKR